MDITFFAHNMWYGNCYPSLLDEEFSILEDSVLIADDTANISTVSIKCIHFFEAVFVFFDRTLISFSAFHKLLIGPNAALDLYYH